MAGCAFYLTNRGQYIIIFQMALPFRFIIITDLDEPIKQSYYYRKTPERDWKRCFGGWQQTTKYHRENWSQIEFAKKTNKPRFPSKLKFPHGY